MLNNNPSRNNPNNTNNSTGQVFVQLEATTEAERTSLAQKVMVFTFFSILAAMAGVWVGYNILHLSFYSRNQTLLLPIAIAFLVLSVVTRAFRNMQGVNFALLYTFTFMSGLLISPTISYMVQTGQGSTVY